MKSRSSTGHYLRWAYAPGDGTRSDPLENQVLRREQVAEVCVAAKSLLAVEGHRRAPSTFTVLVLLLSGMTLGEIRETFQVGVSTIQRRQRTICRLAEAVLEDDDE